MKRPLLLAVGLIALSQVAPIFTAQVHAQAAAVAPEVGEVTCGNEILMRIHTAAGGYTPQQRADHIMQRLIPILSLDNLKPEDVTVQQAAKYHDATICVRGKLLVTVDQALAQSNGNNDPGDLARQWADNFRRVLPEISVKPNPDNH